MFAVIPRRSLWRMLIGLAAVVAASGAVRAQDWPAAKPIKMIVPFAPGGGTDFAGRFVAKLLSDRIGQTVFVENRPGANGIVGLTLVKQSAPDGYTLATATDGPLIYNMPLYREKLAYDTEKDFTLIAVVMALPSVIAVNPSVGAKTIPDLIRIAKEKPGSLNYATAGFGNYTHLGMELFMQRTGTKMVHVPFKGGGPATQALLQGDVHVMFSNLQTLQPHIEAGKLVALGLAEDSRFAKFPNLATVAETVPGFAMAAWTGVFGPKDMPKPIVDRLWSEIEAGFKNPDTIALLDKQHTVAKLMGPDAFAKFVASERALWTKVIDTAGIRPPQN